MEVSGEVVSVIVSGVGAGDITVGLRPSPSFSD